MRWTLQVRPGGMPWDSECLDVFQGRTIIHAGEWEGSTALVEPSHGQTTSVLFQQKLQASFTLVQTVPLPNWPWCRDQLTVWTRNK